jgi:hypothetical protein
MSQYHLNRPMRDISRSAETARRCRTELPTLLADYDLTTAEKEAVVQWELRRLYDLGANPLLLLTSSMAMGTNIRDYVTALRKQSPTEV